MGPSKLVYKTETEATTKALMKALEQSPHFNLLYIS